MYREVNWTGSLLSTDFRKTLKKRNSLACGPWSRYHLSCNLTDKTRNCRWIWLKSHPRLHRSGKGRQYMIKKFKPEVSIGYLSKRYLARHFNVTCKTICQRKKKNGIHDFFYKNDKRELTSEYLCLPRIISFLSFLRGWVRGNWAGCIFRSFCIFFTRVMSPDFTWYAINSRPVCSFLLYQL